MKKIIENNKDYIIIGVVSIIAFIIGCLAIVIVVLFVLLLVNNGNSLPKLPTPEVTGGERGSLGIDKNINDWY